MLSESIVLGSLFFLIHMLMLLSFPEPLEYSHSMALAMSLLYQSALSSQCSDCQGKLKRPVFKNNKQRKKYLGTDRAFPLLYNLSFSKKKKRKKKISVQFFISIPFHISSSGSCCLSRLPAMTPNWAPIFQSSIYAVISLIMMFVCNPHAPD